MKWPEPEFELWIWTLIFKSNSDFGVWIWNLILKSDFVIWLWSMIWISCPAFQNMMKTVLKANVASWLRKMNFDFIRRIQLAVCSYTGTETNSWRFLAPLNVQADHETRTRIWTLNLKSDFQIQFWFWSLNLKWNLILKSNFEIEFWNRILNSNFEI